MSQARVLGIIGVAALAVATAAVAQTTVTPIPESDPVETRPLAQTEEKTTWGDPQKGATIAGTCAACHGLDGNPTDPQYPRLAGQSERYIAQQLALFRSGERSGGMAAVMKPFADMLSAQESRDVGAYFAIQESGAGVADDTLVTEGPYEGMKFFEVGQQLFLRGDAERGIPACMACHGPAGAGNPGPAYPRLAGQMADYTKRRLEFYRAGESSREDAKLFEVMASVSHELTDLEIGALASYLEGLHPRAEDIAAAHAPVAVAAAAATPAQQVEAGAEIDAAAAVEAATDVPDPDPALSGEPQTEPLPAQPDPADVDLD